MVAEINSERLWRDIMAMAKIGGTPKGGCNRQTLTDLDLEGRILFASWCNAIGLTLSYDSAGNMFACLVGKDNTLPPLVVGSHLDTQPTGGKFDGVLGVLSGLEALRRLHELGIQPIRSVEIACWMNEEGARFAPAMMGSAVWAGVLDIDDVRKSTDANGITVGEELDRYGYSKEMLPTEREIGAYIELHIEQGPVLEANDIEIGVVTGAQGIRWYDVVLSGQETHAGPSPMSMRQDPMSMIPELVAGVFDIAKRDALARATIGQLHAFPGSRNVVPGRVEASIDLRHPDEEILTEMNNELFSLIETLPKKLGLEATISSIWHSPVISFDTTLVNSIRNSAQQRGYSYMDMVSGAGHDALMVAKKVPTAMIFIPCKGGISHNEKEHIEMDQATAGANVLLSTIMDYLGV